MLKEKFQREKLFSAEKQKLSRYYSLVYLSAFVIGLSHSTSGISMSDDRNFLFHNENENQFNNPEYKYEYVSQSKSNDYAKEDGDVEGTLSSVADDKLRFWWTSGNRTNNKGPPKDKFTGTTEAPPKDIFDPSNTLNFISRLLRYVIINKDSSSRIQFFNTNYKRNSSSVNDTVPRAIFGGPLCLGLCGIAQVYWANSSVQLFSGNKFPLPSVDAPSTVVPLPGQG